MSLFESITARFVKQDKSSERSYRARIGKFQGWISVFVNSFLFVVKIFIGLIIGSISLIADAFHTLSDVVSSAVVIWGFKESEKPPDTEHPFGHGRIEYIATLIIAILLVVVGLEFFKSSIERILNPTPINPTWWMIIVIIATILLKELTARYAEFLSRKISSNTLKADAWHHRADAISSIIVIVAMIAGKYGYITIDGWAGIGVAIFVMWTGYFIAREAINDIIGIPPSDDEIVEIKKVIANVDSVLGVHDITIHSYGIDKFASVHIEVDETISSADAHNIAEDVEQILSDKLNLEPTVHIDPISLNNPKMQDVKSYLDAHWNADDRLNGWHDIRVVDTEKQHLIMFGINVNPGLSKLEITKLCDKMEKDLKNQFSGFEVNIKASPIHKF